MNAFYYTLMFIPLGFTICFFNNRVDKFKMVFLISVTLSLLLCLIMKYILHSDVTSDIFIFNIAGSAIGYLLEKMFDYFSNKINVKE